VQTAARLLAESRTLATLDLLGEDVRDEAQVRRNLDAYERLVGAIATDPRFVDGTSRPTVSVKPSAFTTGPLEAASGPVRALCDRAHAAGVGVTIDMEDRRWTDFTLDLAVRLFRRGLDVGTVLQTRLHRTEGDLSRVPPGMRIRLVIGIYREPPVAALTDKPAMKERMVEFSARLLASGARVEFATHDERFLERFVRDVAPRAPERCEVQMLLGVPRGRFRRTLADGRMGPRLPLRLYVPFALGWDDATAYLRRRMEENPSMALLVLRNLLPGTG
ncbi:MAG: proline dehydrogenase family protein, partial [Planctomycetota bacterium]